LRFLFGFSGSPLADGVIGAGATHTTAGEITAFFNAHLAALDVDGNGTSDALTDGILMLRSFWFQGGQP